MTIHNVVYYIPLDDEGNPTSSTPLIARYNEIMRLWVDEGTDFVIEFVGLVEGENAAYSSTNYDDVVDYVDDIADAWLVDNS